MTSFEATMMIATITGITLSYLEELRFPMTWELKLNDAHFLMYVGTAPLSQGLNNLVQGPTTLDCGMSFLFNDVRDLESPKTSIESIADLEQLSYLLGDVHPTARLEFEQLAIGTADGRHIFNIFRKEDTGLVELADELLRRHLHTLHQVVGA
nr:hypothetical protein CFP56_16718 [Quercus suber]